MAKTTTPTPTKIITTLGFRTTEAFQAAWNLGPALSIDGRLGPKTKAAALISWERHLHNQGDISEHFTAQDFRCHCGGKLAGCEVVLVQRKLLIGLEVLRSRAYPKGLTIVSGYRCVLHNMKVGGADESKHVIGMAADIPGTVKLATMKSYLLFGGIGWKKSNGKCTHVDVRNKSVKAPTTWRYNS